MDTVSIVPARSIGKDFVPAEYLAPGMDEYSLRNAQNPASNRQWRRLHAHELEQLVKNGNTADDWDDFFVADEFDPKQIRNSEFHGLVRIGRLRHAILEHHDLKFPAGITDSFIISCDIGDDVAIHGVRYLAHHIIGDRCILANIDEMNTTNHAKFGNGIVKDGEPESVRIWLEIMNETGGRKVAPFDGMIAADAYLWAKYRDDAALMKRLLEITQQAHDTRRGYYGVVGDQCVIKHCNILKDVKIGSHCYIKGANKIKNLTIHSSEAEPTQIGEGVELVNGIIGYGCHVFYGCKAVRFIIGNNSHLKYGARLINSFLGDNSTISCCEVLNNLIFPAHEQHHNNSFLIASVILGQSNMAAGATIGSNHNSRANDNELQAGRGFWPGLCTSVKHSCRFASFTLLAKGDYPAELDIPLPFALLNNNVCRDELEVMPAYWWMYNMYALARNSWKFKDRDRRIQKTQHIEFDALAPDTVEEIVRARRLLEGWVGKAIAKAEGADAARLDPEELARIGREALARPAGETASLEVLGENMEKSSRKVAILKAHAGYRAYGDMLLYYAVKNLIEFMRSHPEATFASMRRTLQGERIGEWTNLGGQLVPTAEVDRLRADIASQALAGWDDIHRRYDELWQAYPLEKQRHAFAILEYAHGGSPLSPQQWQDALREGKRIQQCIRDQVYRSRKKDYDNSFRHITFRNAEEMAAAIGTVEENSFVLQVRGETDAFCQAADEIARRG